MDGPECSYLCLAKLLCLPKVLSHWSQVNICSDSAFATPEEDSICTSDEAEDDLLLPVLVDVEFMSLSCLKVEK